jgi:hypothetical protein
MRSRVFAAANEQRNNIARKRGLAMGMDASHIGGTDRLAIRLKGQTMLRVNKTDKVYTLDIDGNTVHIFEGGDWNKMNDHDAFQLHLEGAFRAKIHRQTRRMEDHKV